MSYKKIFKSRRNRMLCGVCGGIGEYFGIDPNIIRLAFIIFNVPGLFGYFIAAVLLPDEGEA